MLFSLSSRTAATALPRARGFGLLLAALGSLIVWTQPVLAQSPPTVTIDAADPGLSASLGDHDALYLRISYRTATPVTLRAQGLSAGQPAPGMMSNGIHQVAPGSGEVMAWMAYGAGTAIDAIRVTALDSRGNRIATLDAPARVAWTAGPRLDRGRRSEWAMRMNDEQQRLRRRLAETSDGAELWLGGAIMLTVPLYFVLQVWLPLAWAGGWRLAAIAPLLPMAPAIAWSLHALSHESNLWPLTVILLAPFCFAYLLLLWALRGIGRWFGGQLGKPVAR